MTAPDNQDAYLSMKNATIDDMDGEEFDGPVGESEEKKLINRATKQTTNWYNFFIDNIDIYREDLNFIFVDQWAPDLRAVRSAKMKPILTVNYLKTYVDSLLGQEIQNDPDIVVSATNEHVPQKDVDLRQGLLRQVFYENRFSMVKQRAFLYMLSGGFSVFAVDYDYVNGDTFDKKIIIDAAEDPTIYGFDPMSRQPHRGDGKYCFKLTTMEKSEFHRQFPDATSYASFNIMGDYTNYDFKWVEGSKVKVLDIFVKEFYFKNVVQLSTGESMSEEEAEKQLAEQDAHIARLQRMANLGMYIDPSLLEPVTIANKRKSACYRIIHYKMTSDEILEQGEWPSEYLPYVFVPCHEVMIDGQYRSYSYHRWAQDAQRYLNYLASEAAEALMTSHHGQWIASTKNIDEKLLEQWLSPQQTRPVRIYNESPTGAKPEFVPPPQISPSFETQYTRTVSDIANILGRFEANRGQDGGEKSGRAIDKRAQLGDLSSTKPFENLNLAIEQIANICISLFPAVFDRTRPVVMRDKDGAEQKAIVNQPYMDSVQNDMSTRGFKVEIKTGVSSQAQKMASFEQMMMLVQANPQISGSIMDLLAANLDIENMPQLVDRLKKLMLGNPLPQVIAEESGKQPPQAPPNPMAMEAQMKMQIEQGKLQNAKETNEIKKQQLHQEAVEAAIKEDLERQKLQVQFVTEQLRARAEVQKAELDNRHDMVKHISGHLLSRKDAEKAVYNDK